VKNNTYIALLNLSRKSEKKLKIKTKTKIFDFELHPDMVLQFCLKLFNMLIRVFTPLLGGQSFYPRPFFYGSLV